MDILRKCIITKYDTTITKPPYLRIPLAKVEVLEPEDRDDGGVEFARRLRSACINKGYRFQFYSSYDGEEDYEIVVKEE